MNVTGSLDLVLPQRLKKGDRVRFVSPASSVAKGSLVSAITVLENMGLSVEFGDHIYDIDDTFDYLAGKDEDRLADLNDAIRDSGIKAIIATRGGKGAYRISDKLDFDAARKYPKLYIGFSEITHIHMALLQRGIMGSIHGAPWDAERFGQKSADSFIAAVSGDIPIIIHSSKDEHTITLTTKGKAAGRLVGGNQDALATSAGWGLPDMKGAILLIEAFNQRYGHLDRQLTMLINSGIIRDVAGIAIGQYTGCGNAADPTGTPLNCSEIDILRDRLGRLGVPVLGGLPIGHGQHPVALPIGTDAILDADAGVLTIMPGVV